MRHGVFIAHRCTLFEVSISGFVASVDRIGGDHGAATAIVVVRAIQFVGVMIECKETDKCYCKANNESDNRERLVQWVIKDNIICQHLHQERQQTTQGMHYC